MALMVELFAGQKLLLATKVLFAATIYSFGDALSMLWTPDCTMERRFLEWQPARACCRRTVLGILKGPFNDTIGLW
jgi:hypothetical protein